MAERLRALITAATAMGVAAAGVAGCGVGQHSTGMPGDTAAVPLATPTVSSSELVRRWQTHPLPCEHPISVSAKPADPYHLMETGMWPTSADVAARLGNVTAAGEPEFIVSRLQLLDVVLLQTQSDIADRVQTGTHTMNGVGGDPAAETVIRDESERAVKLRHDNYVAAVDHLVFELEAGAVLPSAQIGHRYRLERVCPGR